MEVASGAIPPLRSCGGGYAMDLCSGDMIPRDLLLKIASRWCYTAPFSSPPRTLPRAPAIRDPFAQEMEEALAHHPRVPATRGPFAQELARALATREAQVHEEHHAWLSSPSSPCQIEDALASRDCTEEVVPQAILPVKKLVQPTLPSDRNLRETHSSDNQAVSKGPRGQDSSRPRSAIAGRLPKDLVIFIAQKLLTSGSRAEVAKMKSVCKGWHTSFEVVGPLLVVSRHPPSPQLITVMKIVRYNNSPPVMEQVCSLHLPPGDSVCWGAVNGLVATRNVNSNRLLLKCLTCGYNTAVPDLQEGLVPKGVFRRNDNAVLALVTNPANQEHMLVANEFAIGADMTQLYVRQIDDEDDGLLHEVDDDGEEGEEVEQKIVLNWGWELYPGAEGHFPMRSINFFQNVSFAGVTQGNNLILDSVDRGLDEDMLTVQAPINGRTMALWMKNGQHIFICEERPYLCILFRSVQDVDHVEAICFSIETDEDGGYELQEVSDIGPYSVYLGSNQSIVLPMLEGSSGHLPNTIYIEDSDGVVRNPRVLAVNINTQHIDRIQYTEDFVFAPVDHTDSISSAWVWSPQDQCHPPE